MEETDLIGATVTNNPTETGMDNDYVLKMRLSRKAWFGHFTGRRNISIKERIIHFCLFMPLIATNLNCYSN